ncbi:hypothetical protein B0H10DRAFT_720927 [Mycena sp. CBHHK59/15]|nr:hypothetical protein B0H10DRAFT_720927 [Mycena sp. CBHHK59/15]
MASHNSDYYPLVHNIRLEPKCKALLLFAAPPPHLFLGLQSEQKMHNYLFIWMCIRRAWLSRIRHNLEDPISWGLTTQKWRDVLSGQYWKQQHPNKDTGVLFDLRYFWKFGGPLIFGSDDMCESEQDISPQMAGSTTGRLEPSHFADNATKALILWDLALCHSQLQLDRADEILYAHTISDPVGLSIRRVRRADLFHDPKWGWKIPDMVPPWEMPLTHRTHRHWLSRLLEVVNCWPCASKMCWFLHLHNFATIKPEGGRCAEAIFCDGLSENDLFTLETSMVAVYYQGVFDSLGILAIGVTKRPADTAAMQVFYLM